MKKNQQLRQGKKKQTQLGQQNVSDMMQPTNEDYVPKQIHPN